MRITAILSPERRRVYNPTDIGFSNATINSGVTTQGAVIDLGDLTLITFYFSGSQTAASTIVLRVRIADDAENYGSTGGLTIDSGPIAAGGGNTQAGFYTIGAFTPTAGSGGSAGACVVLSRRVRLDISANTTNLTAFFVWAHALKL